MRVDSDAPVLVSVDEGWSHIELNLRRNPRRGETSRTIIAAKREPSLLVIKTSSNGSDRNFGRSLKHYPIASFHLKKPSPSHEEEGGKHPISCLAFPAFIRNISSEAELHDDRMREDEYLLMTKTLPGSSASILSFYSCFHHNH